MFVLRQLLYIEDKTLLRKYAVITLYFYKNVRIKHDKYIDFLFFSSFEISLVMEGPLFGLVVSTCITFPHTRCSYELFVE